MLITAEYKKQQTQMHVDIDEYGIASIKYAPIVDQFLSGLNLKTLLDYGAGKGRLAANLKVEVNITEYDPGIPGIEDLPSGTFDMVACIDVLEHIEPECLDDVLSDLCGYIGQYGLFTIATGPAKKVLSDGRNAHLIQEGASFWLPKLCQLVNIQRMNTTKTGFWVLVTPPI